MRWPIPLLPLLALVGCRTPDRVYKPEVDPGGLDDVAFVHYLATVPVVNVDEGTRAVLMLTPTPTADLTYEERSAQLMRIGAIKPAWRLRPGQILDKGTLGYMLRTICGLPRGFNEWLSDWCGLGDRRYALKTCIYEGLMPYAVYQEPVTGGELLSAITAAEQRLGTQPKAEP